MMKVVIMAGGRGTRISSIAPDIPKPLLPIEGVPTIEREVICLRNQGYKDLIITVSHLADKIIDYFSDGSSIGVNIEYFVEKQAIGNAGALFALRDKLTDPFLLLNADILFDIDINRFVDFHRIKGGLVTLFTHPNSHPYDSGVIVADEDGIVQKWFTKEEVRPQWYQNRVNAGLHIIDPKVLDISGIDVNTIGNEIDGKRINIDLDRQILRPLCGTGKMFCYDSPEYVKDMGTPDRYEMICRDFAEGKVKAKNLKQKQKAIFIDRDGTINQSVGFLKNIDEFELLPGVTDAVRKINESGFLAIVVTNQPVIARGEVTREQLREIHNKMETLLGIKGAYIDAIYYCPHHPHKGYPGEVETLKIECDCRKPRPGMLLKAQKDFNLDLESSWIVGDSENDIKAGKAAGCRTALIGRGDYGQNITVDSLIEFVENI